MRLPRYEIFVALLLTTNIDEKNKAVLITSKLEFLIAGAVFGTMMGIVNTFGTAIVKGILKEDLLDGHVLKEGVK